MVSYLFKKSPFDPLSGQLKAFADPTRIHIMSLLLRGEQTATQLNKEVRVCQPTLSHHMKVLCSTGLVSRRKKGVRCLYRIEADNIRSMGRYLQAVADYTQNAQQAADRGLALPDPPDFDPFFSLSL